MFRIFISIIFINIIIISCAKEAEDDVHENFNQPLTYDIKCLRWVDRKLFFADADPILSNKNNEFHRMKVEDTINSLERLTKLGENYFIKSTVNGDNLRTKFRSELEWNDHLSHVQVWPDAHFEEYVDLNYGGVNNIPDPNAITIENPYFKRKFFIVFRASCFESSNRCVSGSSNIIGDPGISALVFRQFGLLMGIPLSDCNDPSDIMCNDPSDAQWNDLSRSRFKASLDAKLTDLQNNVNAYEDAESQDGCLNKSWMDSDLKFAISTQDLEKNNIFQKEEVKEALDLIACNTMLGCNYFSYGELPESELPITLDSEIRYTTSYSSFHIWKDSSFNSYILDDLGTNPPDPNGLTIINKANKSNYTVLLRGSCFTHSIFCSGNNSGISQSGLRALIARQLGLMSGLNVKDCRDYPYDVMCAELPDDLQWSTESQFIWINKFNNYLEHIGNIPNFYTERYYEYEIDEEE